LDSSGQSSLALVRDALAHVATVVTDLIIEVIALILPIAGAITVLLLVLAVVLLILMHGLEVRLAAFLHVDDVVSVARAAAGRVVHGAGVAEAEAETDQALGGDAHIFLVIGIFVRLLGAVAALELEGHVGDPGVVDLVIFVVLMTTSLGEDGLSDFGFGLHGCFGSINSCRIGLAELVDWIVQYLFF